MEEVKEKTRHEQLKYRIRNKIDAETFNCMPVELQDFLIESDPADMKDAYLSILLKLPWKSVNVSPKIDLLLAKRLLDRSHYAMYEVKEKILRYMACQKHLGTNYGAVLLLTGPPGVGKTTIAASIAAAMGRPCVKISLAGVSDALFLRGSQTIFKDARPGRITDALVRSKSFCPLILLDEIDKMGNSIDHGDPESVLLDILDSDRSEFVDNYLGFPLDLSNVIFMATANRLEPLSPILKDRLDIVELPPYSPSDKKQIVNRYLWPKLLREYRLDCLDDLCDPEGLKFENPESLRLDDSAVDVLIERCPEDGVRDLERLCRKLCESVIGTFYATGIVVKVITAENLDLVLAPIYYK